MSLRYLRLLSAAITMAGALVLSGCVEHATEADKAAAAQAAAARQQQADELAAARRTIPNAEQQLAQLPPPAKARYLQVRTPDGWSNPFLIVSRRTLTLRIVDQQPGDTLPNNVLAGQKLRPSGPRKRELTLRLIDLPQALAALPEESWSYGRVIAVEEDPTTPRRERPFMRRNLEAVLGLLNDLDIVVDEWPYGQR